jgi:hypothetical protein
MITTVLDRVPARRATMSSPTTTTAPEPTGWTDGELIAVQEADFAEDQALDELMWTREGKVRVACAGCDGEFHVPLLVAASAAYCRSTSWACFPPGF